MIRMKLVLRVAGLLGCWVSFLGVSLGQTVPKGGMGVNSTPSLPVLFRAAGTSYGETTDVYTSLRDDILILPGGFVLGGRSTTRELNLDSTRQTPAGDREVLVQFVRSESAPSRIEAMKSPVRVRRYIGSDESGWMNAAEMYDHLVDRGVWPGIDVVYHGKKGRFEFDFVVKAGIDPRVIILDFHGAAAVTPGTQGELIVRSGLRDIELQQPLAINYLEGREYAVPVSWKQVGPFSYGFELGAYDPRGELIIDPIVAAFSTYLGSSGQDVTRAVSVDGQGNLYVTGDAANTTMNFSSAPQTNTLNAMGGTNDAFVAKYTPQGVALWVTFFGGSGAEGADDIVVNSSGTSWAVGSTFPLFGVLPIDFPHFNTALPAGGGNSDGYLVSIDSNGVMLYATRIGDAGGQRVHGVSLDSDGGVWVCGSSTLDYLGGITPAIPITLPFVSNDAFALHLKESPAGSFPTAVQGTYIGNIGQDVPNDIAIGPDGDVYIVGVTTSISPLHPALGVTPPLFTNNVPNGNGVSTFPSAFAARFRFSTSPASIVYATYLGGTISAAATGGASFGDRAMALGIDSAGDAVVVGMTACTDFPVTAGSFQTVHSDAGTSAPSYGEGFVSSLQFDASTNTLSLEWSTFLGGVAPLIGAAPNGYGDGCENIFVDAQDDLWIVGTTNSTGFPQVNALQAYGGGLTDSFLVRMSNKGSNLYFSSFFGGSGSEEGFGLVADNIGTLAAFCGYTTSTNLPLAGTPPEQSVNAGGVSDAFVSRFLFPGVSVSPLSINFGTVPVGSTVTLNLTVSNLSSGSMTFNSVSTPASPFSIPTPPVLPVIMSGGGSMTFGVQFSPTTTGNFNSIILISTDDLETPVVAVALIGKA